MLNRFGLAVAAVSLISFVATPSDVEAQACGPGALCPAGYACMNGVCQPYAPEGQVQVQVQGQYPPQQQYPQQQYPQQYPQQQYQQPQYYAPPQQQPAPPRQTRTERRPIIGLVVPGAVLLGVSWIIHAAVVSPFAGWSIDRGYQPEWDAFRAWGLLPLAGPWIQLAIKPDTGGRDGWDPYLVIDGILQAGGLTMLILGLAIQERHEVYVDNERAPGPQFAVLPMVTPEYSGLSLAGIF